MNGITIAWLLLPLLAAFLCALLPAMARVGMLFTCLATAAMALAAEQNWLPDSLQLIGELGITLQPDGLAAPFLLLNALVCGAVLVDTWGEPRGKPWFLLLLVLHGSVNTLLLPGGPARGCCVQVLRAVAKALQPQPPAPECWPAAC